jgi:hypothetical protein
LPTLEWTDPLVEHWRYFGRRITLGVDLAPDPADNFKLYGQVR